MNKNMNIDMKGEFAILSVQYVEAKSLDLLALLAIIGKNRSEYCSFFE